MGEKQVFDVLLVEASSEGADGVARGYCLSPRTPEGAKSSEVEMLEVTWRMRANEASKLIAQLALEREAVWAKVGASSLSSVRDVTTENSIDHYQDIIAGGPKNPEAEEEAPGL